MGNRIGTLSIWFGAGLMVISLAGCGAISSLVGGGNATVVTISNKVTTVTAGTQYVFQASTQHNQGNPQGITWSIMPASGEGTLSSPTSSGASSSVTYTAPANTCSSCVTITATSVENPSSTDSDTVSIAGSTLAVATTSMPNGVQNVPYGATLEATGGTPPYSWTVVSGSLPAGLGLHVSMSNVTGQTLNSVSGTPTATGTAQFTVQVSDSTTPPTVKTQALSITVAAPSNSNNAELNGQYAFGLNAFGQGAGVLHTTVGSFTADGNGNITGGAADFNGPGGAGILPVSGGTYAVGSDHRGTATISFSGGPVRTIAFALGSFNNQNVATAGKLIQFDYEATGGGQVGSGPLYLQQPASFALASVNGAYAFQVVGQGPATTVLGPRVAEVGAFTADGAGNLTSGEFDLNAGGTATNTAFTAKLSVDPANTATVGRLTLSLSSGGSGNAVIYLVNPGHALVMTTDPNTSNPVLSGEMLAQSSAPYTNASFSGNAVFYLEGQGQTANDSAATLGLVSGDGNGNLTLVSQDKNDSGVHTTKSNQTGLTYSVKADGRAAVAGSNNAPVFYLVSASPSAAAFIMDTSGSVGAGYVQQQSAAPFAISGNYFWGGPPPGNLATAATTGVATSSGNGTVNFTADISTWLGLLPDQAAAATGLNFSANGVGTESLGDVIYVISPTQAVVMSTSDTSPEVVVLEQ